jgi:hypothetical protein
MSYFYWQKTFHGSFSPVMSRDAPSEKKSDGSRGPSYKGVVKLSDEEKGMTLAQLAEKYPAS